MHFNQYRVIFFRIWYTLQGTRAPEVSYAASSCLVEETASYATNNSTMLCYLSQMTSWVFVSYEYVLELMHFMDFTKFLCFQPRRLKSHGYLTFSVLKYDEHCYLATTHHMCDFGGFYHSHLSIWRKIYPNHFFYLVNLSYKHLLQGAKYCTWGNVNINELYST